MFKRLIILIPIFASVISLMGQSYGERLIPAKDTITDKDLVVPEDIERNFDQLLVDWKKDMEPSSSCTSNYDTDVAYPDSVYINRLYSLPTVMELAYNPVVRSYIDMYTGRMRSSVEYFLGKSNYYFPIFEEALDKYGLPLELKYLPIIESALNPTIVSKAGATGLWQFMLGTGKMYDLEINSLVDERRDPIRSTDAAARYLKDLYNIYGDWNLVIAAYNCGPGNVNKAIKRNGGQSDYWSIYPYLPKETRGYVPAFIAATYVMNYPEAHNICPFEYKYSFSTDTILIDKYLHFQQLADVLNLPMDEVRRLNPQFKNDIIPGEFKQYTIKLPSISAADFQLQKDSVYSYRANEFLVHRKVVEPNLGNMVSTIVRYKVRRGESLASIASKQGVTTKQIRRWNRLKSNRVQTGQVLSIHKTIAKPKTPMSTDTSDNHYYADNKSAKPAPTTNDIPNVERDSIASTMLADYFSKNSTVTTSDNATSVTVLANHPDNPNDESGVNEETRTPDEPQTIYHKVRIGETVALIAAKYNVDKDDLIAWNRLKSVVPKIGQRLLIHLPTRFEDAEGNTTPDDILEPISSSDVLLSVRHTPNANNATYAKSSIANEGPIAMLVQSKSKVVAKNNTKTKPKSKTKQPSVYTVKKGDTLSDIANKMGGKCTASNIMKANKMKSNKLKIGQKLKIPR